MVEKTKLMKPTDKAIFGMVSKSAGRNESEPTGGLVKLEPRRPSPQHEGEGSMDWRRLTDAPAHSGIFRKRVDRSQAYFDSSRSSPTSNVVHVILENVLAKG